LPPSPAPVPKPDTGKWNVTDEMTNVTYILAEMAVQLNITYVTVIKNVVSNVCKLVPCMGL
jgi:hypothetical protein